MDLLDLLEPLSTEGKEYISSVRYIDEEDGRIEKLQKFGESIPKYYKDTIASLEPENNKSPLKLLKESRKTKDTLKSLLTGTLETIEEKELRPSMAKLVLDYQISLVSKREYLTQLSVIADDTIRKDFLTIRKWMDSKKGALLQEAFFDYATNHTRRSWQTILDTHKKITEEDIHLLISHFDVKRTPQVFADKVAAYKDLPQDKMPPPEPLTGDLAELLNM
jgi:hypothetical protein